LFSRTLAKVPLRKVWVPLVEKEPVSKALQ